MQNNPEKDVKQLAEKDVIMLDNNLNRYRMDRHVSKPQEHRCQMRIFKNRTARVQKNESHRLYLTNTEISNPC